MRKILTHSETGRERADIDLEWPTRGPTTGAEPESPLAFIIKNATPEELAELKARVAARVEKEPRFVYEKCSKCGLVMPRPYRARAGRQCAKCNWTGLKDGGFMVEMKPGEVRAHLAARKVEQAKAAERMSRAAFEEFNTGRRKEGRREFARAEWDKLQAKLAAEARTLDAKKAALWQGAK